MHKPPTYCCNRYDLRVQGMLLQLEFAEKKGDLEPSLETFHRAVDGNHDMEYKNTSIHKYYRNS